jgi:hypothetical protein
MAFVHTPHKLLDTLIWLLKLKNDAELARTLDVASPVVSKIRNRKLAVGATLLIRVHELTDLPVKEIRELAAA